MAINLSLNDFRSVLGQVNDGNVVLKQDKSGIEKANYGNAFKNLFRSVRTAKNDPQENMQIRQALLDAISSSAEGKILSRADMERIYIALGMPEGTDIDTYAGKRADMLAALSYNISRAAAAMKLQPGKKLPNAAIRHAVLNMGLIDGTLVKSITSLSDSDYNALLMDAEREENTKEGVYGLSTALSVLRGAGNLLEQVQQEEE